MDPVNEIASHSEEVTTPSETQGTAVQDAFAAFGLTAPEKQENASDEASQETDETEEVSTPPTEQEKPKGVTVKFNKEETFVDEEKIPEYVRKGLNYDKIEGRSKEYQTALDEVAQMQGFKDHAELMTNLPKMKEQQQQQQHDQFDQLKQKLIDDLVYNGVDEQTARDYAESNPLVAKARATIEQEEARRQEDAQTQEGQRKAQQFDVLYTEFPDLKSEIKEDGTADWYTPQMHELVSGGTPPLIAYRALNAENIAEKKAKAATARAIKDVHLGKRSQVETVTTADTEPSVPAYLESAFSAFGLPTSAAKKYVKK